MNKKSGNRPRVAWAAFILAMMLALLFAPGSASGAIVGSSFPVAETSGDELLPDVGGGVAVWEDGGGADSDILGKDLETDTNIEVSTAPGDQFRPKVGGAFVVWEDYRNGSDGDVFARNLTTGTEIPVASGPNPQRRPDISGGKVVWEENRGSGWKLYGYDLATSQPFTVSESAGDKRRPAISGGLVVWENHPGTGLSDIRGKRLASGGEFSISANASIFEDTPDVSGSTVVWREEGPREEGSRNYDVYGKDLESGEEFEVCVDAADQHSPSVSGKLVVWVDGRGSNADVFGLDLETGDEFRISGEDEEEDSPAISGETVVWEGQRTSGTNFGDWDIHGSSLDAAPAAPKGLVAVGTLGGVELSWTPNTEEDLTHYNVYREDAGGTFQQINTDPLIATSFSDESAPKGVVSRYEVRAVDGAGQESAPASASAAALANTSVTLAASATSINFGESVDLSGSLASDTGGGPSPLPNREVVLEARPAGANAFEEVSTTDTTGDGGFVFEDVAPTGNTDYRARFAGDAASGFAASVSVAVSVGVVAADTSLTVDVSPSVVDYGDTTRVTGRLLTGGTGVSGKAVILEARPDGATGFTGAGRTQTSFGGTYSFNGLRPDKHTHYRVRFEGAPGLNSSVSQATQARVRAVVSTKLSAARVNVGKAVVVSGSVAPAHSGNVTVIIRSGGRAVSENNVSLTSSTSTTPLNASEYRLSYKPKKRGTYTVEVRFPGDGDHLGGVGPTRSFTAV